jgi:alpha-beta hydrolase superfamily lysophospholipase
MNRLGFRCEGLGFRVYGLRLRGCGMKVSEHMGY